MTKEAMIDVVASETPRRIVVLKIYEKVFDLRLVKNSTHFVEFADKGGNRFRMSYRDVLDDLESRGRLSI